MLLLYSLSSEDRESLRVAHLASQVLTEAKGARQINIRQYQGDRKEAFDRLRYWNPPLIGLVTNSQEWYEATPPAKKMTTAKLLSKLIERQHEKIKKIVRVDEGRKRVLEILLYLLILDAIVVTISGTPPSGGVLTFNNPLSIASGIVAFALLASIVVLSTYFSRFRPTNRPSREQVVATNFFDAYLSYKDFIGERNDMGAAEKAQKLVRRASEQLKLTPTGSRWAILVPELEEIASIGRTIKHDILPIMEDHLRSRNIGDVLVILARCFMETKQESLKVATETLGDLLPKPLGYKPSGLDKIASKLGGYSHAYPYLVGFLISVVSLSLLYVFLVTCVTREPLVPSAISIVVVVGVMAGLGALIGHELKS